MSAVARSKIESLTTLMPRVVRAQRAGGRIVFTNGCFDLLHVGHVRSLEESRSLGDRLIVAINSDSSVRRAKGAGRPIQPARARMELVAALGCVDWVVGFRADTPIRLIRALRPSVLVKGGDWGFDAIVGAQEVESWGGRVVRAKVVSGTSTSRLVEQIRRSPARAKR